MIPTDMATHMFRFRKYNAIPKTADPMMLFINSEYRFLLGLCHSLYITYVCRTTINTSLKTVVIAAPLYEK